MPNATSPSRRWLLLALFALLFGGLIGTGLLLLWLSLPSRESPAPVQVAAALAQPAAPPTPQPLWPPPAPTVENANPLLDPLKPNLQLWLPFINSVEDSSDHKHPVNFSGKVDPGADGAHFNGDGILVFPHIDLENQPFAIAMWIKPEGPIENMGLLQQFDVDKPNHHLHLMLREPDFPRLGFYINDLQATRHVTPQLGWSHLVFQYTGWKQELYLNGTLIAAQDSVAYKGTTGPTLIGRAPNWHGNPPTQNFKGWMRDLRIYTAALTAQQARALAQLPQNTPAPILPRPPPPPPPVEPDQF